MKKPKLLSGNYKPKKAPAEDGDLEIMEKVEEFEKAALAKLGGSICFVRGRKLIGDDEKP